MALRRAASIVERAVELANNNWTLPAEPTQLAIGAAATANAGYLRGGRAADRRAQLRDPRAELARQPGPDLRPDPQLGHHERRPQAPRPLRRPSRTSSRASRATRPATSRPTTPWWSGSPVRSSARSVPPTSAAATSSGRWTRRSPRPGTSSTSRAHCSGPRRRITRTTRCPSYARDLVAKLIARMIAAPGAACHGLHAAVPGLRPRLRTALRVYGEEPLRPV